MSPGNEPWNKKHRPILDPVSEHPSPVETVIGPFRPDASTFRPGPESKAPLAQNLFVQPPDSPYYELETTTFVPPSPSMPATPGPEFLGRSTLMFSSTGNRKSYSQTSTFNMPVLGEKQDIRSLWDIDNQPARGPARYASAASKFPIPDYSKGENGFPTIFSVPDSSLAFRALQNFQNVGGQAPPTYGSSSRTSSTYSSTIPSTSIAAPFPRRSLFASKSVNEHIWSSPAPLESSSNIIIHASGSPERRNPTGYNHGLASREASAIGAQFGRRSQLPSPFYDNMAGRETPGGVALPHDIKSHDQMITRLSGLNIATSQPQDGVKGQQYHIQSQGHANNTQPFQASKPNRHGENGSYTSLESYASPEGSKTFSSATTPSPARAANARALAEFIRAGGAEAPANKVQMPNTPMARPRTMSHSPSPYVQHNNAAAPMQMMQNIPDPLVQQWKAQGGLTWDDLAEHLPLVERATLIHAGHFGVIKIADIPFGVSKPEIVALIGEKAPMVKMPRKSGTYAIHIIMERATAKSNDCYVEFETYDAAAAEAARLQSGRRLVGHRRARIELSSQEDMMMELFPRAKCVQWKSCDPNVQGSKDEYLSGFQGFVTGEEMYATAKIAQNPSRYQFTHRHPQRTYESMISLMAKYPWTHTQLYTVGERNRIFKTVLDQIVALVEHLRRHGSAAPLDMGLLHQLLHAGLKCPGFSERQRTNLIDATQGYCRIEAYVNPVAKEWMGEAIGIQENTSVDMILYILELLNMPGRDSTMTVSTLGNNAYTNAATQVTSPQDLSLAQMAAARGKRMTPTKPQQRAKSVFKITYLPDKDTLTMAQLAQLEWDAIEAKLRSVVRQQ